MTQELATVRSTEEGGRSYIIVGLLILALAAGLRFWQIGSFSFWEDELYSIATATQANTWYSSWGVGKSLAVLQANDGFWNWKFSDPHPPLYEMLLSLWVALFGTSELVVRGLGALFGVLAVASALVLPAAIPRGGRMLYAMLLACSGPLLIYSQDARNYMLGVCLVAWMFALTLQQWSDDYPSVVAGRPRAWLLVLAALLMLTHFYGILMVFAFAAVMTLQASGWRAMARAALRWCLPLVPIAIYVYFGWEGIAYKLGSGPAHALSFGMAFKRNLVGLLHNFVPSAHATTREFWVFFLFLVLLVWGVVRTRSADRTLAFLLKNTAFVSLVFFLAMALATRRVEFFAPRYLIFMIPGMLLLVAMLASYARWSRWLCGVLAVVLVVLGVRMWQESPRPQNFGEWRGASAHAAQLFRPGDVVVLSLPMPWFEEYYVHYLRKYIPAQHFDPAVVRVMPDDDGNAVLAPFMAARPSRVLFFTYIGGLQSKLEKVVESASGRWPCQFDGWQAFGNLRVGAMNCRFDASAVQ